MTASSQSKPRIEVRIAPARYDDLPGLATCHLLASSGPSPSTFQRLLYPFQPALFRTGVHPRHWPAYDSVISERARNLRDGLLVFAAFAKDESGAEVVVGEATMTPPRVMLENARKRRKWNERVFGDVVYPAVGKIRNTLWKDHIGVDPEFLRAFKDVQFAARERVDKERQYFLLNLLRVHSSYQGKGVGSALLDHCCSIADNEGVPMTLESSEKGLALYTSRGFVLVDAVNLMYNGERVRLPCMVRQPMSPSSPPKDIVLEDGKPHSDTEMAKESV